MGSKCLFLVIVFVSNVIQVITGFAGTMLAMPPSIMLIGADRARAILNCLGLCVSIGICIRCRKNILWKKLGNIIIWMGIGMFAGLRMLRFLPQDILFYGYGLIIIAIALKNMICPNKMAKMEKLAIPILFLAGMVHGMFVSGGALLVMYAVEAIPDKEHFRATISAVWVVLNSLLLLDHICLGLFDLPTILLGASSLLPLFLAFVVGNYLCRKIKQETFLKITYVLLVISGISMIF